MPRGYVILLNGRETTALCMLVQIVASKLTTEKTIRFYKILFSEKQKHSLEMSKIANAMLIIKQSGNVRNSKYIKTANQFINWARELYIASKELKGFYNK